MGCQLPCQKGLRAQRDEALSEQIKALAHERRRFGYRRIWQLLRRDGIEVNHKKV